MLMFRCSGMNNTRKANSVSRKSEVGSRKSDSGPLPD